MRAAVFLMRSRIAAFSRSMAAWGDIGEMWKRYGRDMGEIWARDGGGMREIWGVLEVE